MRRPPSLKDLNLLCWGALLVCFVLPFLIVVLSSHSAPDGDFAGFYSLGKILNVYPAQKLYDVDLLRQVCTMVHPRKGGYGPMPYPPFVGLFFRPFALLPFWVAYLLWTTITLALYLRGLWVMLDRFLPVRSHARSLLIGLAFGYAPFIIDTASNGQIAAIGFLALAMAMREDDRGNLLQSGLLLGICSYKPTLLALLLPMLLVTRRWRTLLGFGLGGATLAAITSLFEGARIWSVFFHSILSFSQAATGSDSASTRLLVKYVDLTAFSSLLPGGRTWPILTILIVSGATAFLVLARMWWIAPRQGKPFRWMMWAATLTWTLLLNVYVPIYDTILIVLSVVLTAGALRETSAGQRNRWFTVSWVLILICSWFTVALAARTDVQLLTLLIAAFGTLQLVMLRRLETSTTT